MSLINLPLVFHDNKNREWKLYSVLYEGVDGQYGTYISAVSFEHAQLMLQDLKDTGQIFGEIVDTRPA